MKLGIISDGTPGGTKVINVATGEAVENVVAVAWSITADIKSQGVIYIDYVEADIEGVETPVPERMAIQ